MGPIHVKKLAFIVLSMLRLIRQRRPTLVLVYHKSGTTMTAREDTNNPLCGSALVCDGQRREVWLGYILSGEGF